MIKIFAAWCVCMVLLLAYANYQGYVFANIFESESSAGGSANQHHK